MESSQELRDIKINTEVSKDKQKSQAKQILQQKRKALSELFKALQRIGLSYKAGLMGCEQVDCSIEFARLPPIDINAGLESLTPKLADNDLRYAWSESESYFFKSVSQTTALKAASEVPKLGKQEMDRIKGFINDLKNVTWKTKNVLALQINCLIKFRSMIYLSDLITESNSVMFNPPQHFQEPINYIINSINILQQFKMVIQGCNENMDYTSIDSVTSLLNLSTCDCSSKTKENKLSEDVTSDLDDIINLTQKTLNSIIDEKTNRAMKLCDVNFIVREKYDASITMCDKVSDYIKKFYKKVWINENSTINKHDFEHQMFVSDSNNPPLEEVDSLINQVLKSVEKLYKKHTDTEIKNEEKLLKYLIIQPLSSDLESCDLNSINNQLKNVLKLSANDNLLRSCRPLFDQYALLVQYFITQQTMVYRALSKMNYLLSTLFTDLISNGFCIPDELLEDENGTQSDGKSGMGLTEGEGKKDVSDQIESQDQLEDAKKDYNNEMESQEKDLEEEEKGVEMSDDFDGKLHNIDKDENDNSDSENNDDDKEMGETGEGADTLDEKLWGSDSEDENGDNQETQDLKEEDGKGGESMGDKELRAKSDLDDVTELDEKEEIDHENNKKDINELDENGEKVGEDHLDPHHGDLQPPPEPEPMDLPNDLQLDEGEINDTQENEDNPFDIDAMKENMEVDVNENDEECKENPNEGQSDLECSDEENDGNKLDEATADSNGELEEDNNDDDSNKDGGKKDEEKTGENPLEDDSTKNIEQAKSSEDKPSQVEAQPSRLDDGGSKDQVCEKYDGQDDTSNIETNKEEATGPETQGVGQSQRESKETEQGHSVDENKGSQSEESGTKDKKRRIKPGEMDIDRTLAESTSMKKRLKTTDTHDKDDDHSNENEIEFDEKKKGEIFKHVKESKKGDTETLDAATNEQLEKRPVPNDENQMGEALKEDDDMEIEEDVNEENPESGDKILPDKINPKNRNSCSTMNELENLGEDENDVDNHIDVDGEVILTHSVERGMDNKYHTADFKEDDDVYCTNVKDHTNYIKNQIDVWSENENKEMLKDDTWHLCMDTTSCLAQELSEQLRLVLEPSKASRLQGDFRTGRRINMRRVIPYIASQFKKDKIWLRRTRPSKRQYQIIMAVDNSSSMMDNYAKIMAFESLALVSKALTLVEAGELGVMSFGEQARIIHPLGEPFTDQTGTRLVNDLTFNEQKTKVGELIELATAVFENRGRLDTGDRPAQLLVIMSDGRGIKCEGSDVVKNAIRAAKCNGIFIVFIVIDNPTSKESILDIKMPIFENNSVRIESYMDNFPFPFYVILRDVGKLPDVLSDALREWFELVTK